MSLDQDADISPTFNESQPEDNISDSSSRGQSPDTPPTPHESQLGDFQHLDVISVDGSESESNSEDEECLDYGPSVPQELGDDSLIRMQALKKAVINSKTGDLAIQRNDHRKVKTTKRGLATAYIDRDDSGNYNPKCQRTAPLKKKRPATSRGQDDEIDIGVKKHRNGGCSRTGIIFHFTNSAAIEYLKSRSPQNFDTTISKDIPRHEKDNSKEDKKRKLRHKASPAVTRDDGLTLDDLSENYPQQRGCKGCFHLGNDGCSLIDCADDWPCIQCEESGIDCQLIIPPTLKLMCTLCKFKKVSCSYSRNGGLGVERCTACEENNNICCAGPLYQKSELGKRRMNVEFLESSVESSSNLPSLAQSDKDTFSGPRVSKPKVNQEIEVGAAKALASKSNKAVEPDPFKGKISFHNVNTAKQQKPKKFPSSLSSGNSSPEWRHLNSKYQRKLKQLKPIKPRGQKPHSGFPVTDLLPFTDSIQHIGIKTCFTHPIALNHVPAADGSDPCSWCASPFFGIHGHGQTTVQVIPYGGELGNIEVPGTGGHLQAGKPPNKMCLSCTFQRCRIAKCKSHEVTKLEEIEGESFNAGKLTESMVLLHAGDINLGSIALQKKWCSICTSPAAFSCSRPQPFSVDGIMNQQPGQSTTNPIFKGCGLYLCTVCDGTLQRIRSSQSVDKKTIVESLIEVRTRELWKYEGDEIRADSSFLMAGSELMVRLKEIASGK